MFRRITVLCCVLLCVAAGRLSAENRDHKRIRVLVVYHSTLGHTEALAKAVGEGTQRVANTDVEIRRPAGVSCRELLAADAVVIGSPVYWSNMAAEIKAFFDRWTTECKVVPPAFQMKDKVGAAFTTGGGPSSGKETTLLGIVAAMLANRMVVVSEGEALGAAASTGEGKAPLAESDLQQGRQLGERVARVAHALKH